MENRYDVVVAGGGPAGLSAALILGRARKRVLLCDAGPPRNAAADRMHGFVTRDGTPPMEFRRVAREQLAPYRDVEVRDARVEAVRGGPDALDLELSTGPVTSRRVLLCTGMVDELPDLPGYRDLWGKAIFQCPHCHGWEARDGRLGFIPASAQMVEWALFLQSWSRDVVVFTDGRFEVPDASRRKLTDAGVRVEQRRLRRIIADGDRIAAVELEDGACLARDVLFAHPSQRQTDLVARMGLELDKQGFVRVDDVHETSRRGVFAAGDLTSIVQGALVAAAAGARAAYALSQSLAAGHEARGAD